MLCLPPSPFLGFHPLMNSEDFNPTLRYLISSLFYRYLIPTLLTRPYPYPSSTLTCPTLSYPYLTPPDLTPLPFLIPLYPIPFSVSPPYIIMYPLLMSPLPYPHLPCLTPTLSFPCLPYSTLLYPTLPYCTLPLPHFPYLTVTYHI